MPTCHKTHFGYLSDGLCLCVNRIVFADLMAAKDYRQQPYFQHNEDIPNKIYFDFILFVYKLLRTFASVKKSLEGVKSNNIRLISSFQVQFIN